MDELLRWLKTHGYDCVPKLTGIIERFREPGSKQDDYWVIGSQNAMPGGRSYITLTLGDYRTREEFFFNELDYIKEGLTDEEKKQLLHSKKAFHERQQKEQEAKKQRQEEVSLYAQKLWEGAKVVTSHPYVHAKGLDGFGFTHRVGEDGALLIPLTDNTGKIWSLQRIYPNGDKRFLSGGKKSGLFYCFNPHNNSYKRVGIAEGYSTAISVYVGSNHIPVFVAFDCGSLGSVTKAILEKYPDSEICVFSDNDCWKGADGGNNPGLDAAIALEKEYNTKTITPPFSEADRGLTDWNDYHAKYGTDALRLTIESHMHSNSTGCSVSSGHDRKTHLKPAARQDGKVQGLERDIGNDGDASVVFPESGWASASKKPGGPGVSEEESGGTESGSHKGNGELGKFTEKITPLGFREEHYYYISSHSKRIIALKATEHTKLRLYELQPYAWWEANFTKTKETLTESGKVRLKTVPPNWEEIASDLMASAKGKDYFNSKRVRGSGCFIDEGKLVVNKGDKLIVDKKEVAFSEHKSEYIYTPGPRVDLDLNLDLTPNESEILGETAKQFNWRCPSHADYLLGWMLLAPFCGALSWRPHIWLTGDYGAGKSWTLEHFIYPFINHFAELFLSRTTEAGIRQSCENNAMAVLWDEPESENKEDNDAIQRVLTLARQASFESSGRIAKGTVTGKAVEFNIKSMFLLGSIRSSLQNAQDESRFTILYLNKDSNPQRREQNFIRIKNQIAELARAGIAGKLFSRVYNNWDTLMANIETISEAIRKNKEPRFAEQYGPLIAARLLIDSTCRVTLDEASDIISTYPLDSNFAQSRHVNSKTEIVEFLLGKTVEVVFQEGMNGPVEKRRVSVAEVIDNSVKVSELEKYGLKYFPDKDSLFVCNPSHPEAKKFFSDSKFCANYIQALERLPDAEHSQARCSGMTRRGVLINLAKVRDLVEKLP